MHSAHDHYVTHHHAFSSRDQVLLRLDEAKSVNFGSLVYNYVITSPYGLSAELQIWPSCGP